MNEPSVLRVTEVQRDRLKLHDGHREYGARMLPALVQALQIADDALAVGDWVHAACDTFRQWWVGARVPPRNQIARRNTYGHRQVLVSNVDMVLAVMGLDHDYNLRRLERFLALAKISGVAAGVVLTKADLGIDVAQRLRRVRERLPAGVDAVALNGLDRGACAALAPWLRAGHTLVLLGSSGAGKSTLINTLSGNDERRTGATRIDDSRGRHTTTSRTLHRLPSGACIIDTPGLRTLRLDADEEDLAAAFDDIARWATMCRFRNCRHEGEPGCAVQLAVPAERLHTFHKLQREARRDTLSAVERHEQVRLWKARGRDALLRARAKRG
jgi:ribosome biogenesis GTPase